MTQITVAGAGAFGTALAVSFASDGNPVQLWARDDNHVNQMRLDGQNARYLADRKFPQTLNVTSSLSHLKASDILLVAVPTQSLRPFLSDVGDQIAKAHLVLCCKGVEKSSGLLPTEVVADVFDNSVTSVLTGPGFASEISAGLPTALTLAGTNEPEGLGRHLKAPNLRLYLSHDPVGAQLGGALKNVVAIASGLAIGAGLGESARAAVMTRGFAEMSRLARAMGAEPATLAGLSGFGDLALTCTSHLSRNFSLGYALGKGEAEKKGVTYEGAATAEATEVLAAKLGVEMPLTEIVIAILHGKLTVSLAVAALLARPLRHEQE